MNKKLLIAFGGFLIIVGVFVVVRFGRHTTPTFSGVVTSTAQISVPTGFTVSVYARDLGDPRVLVQYSRGLLVSSPQAGKIFALVNEGGAVQTKTVLSGLRKPHGIIISCKPDCKLYVAEENKLTRYSFDETTATATGAQKLLDLPAGGRHTTRSLLELDNSLLISIGSSCDVCHEQNPWRGSVIEVDLDGKNPRLFATGLRNSVYMTRNYVTGEVWATEMGRDYLGDDLPPDEINILKSGQNYGWPICYGKNVHDGTFDKNVYIRNPCDQPNEQPSHVDLQAHSAPLGIVFVPEEGWPENLWYHALVAYHGSWNRSVPTGYKIVDVALGPHGEYRGTSDFAAGWLKGSETIGRPAGLLAVPGGTLFVTDDAAGIVYKIAYTHE